MTDYIVKETPRGKYGVYSAFNDTRLNAFNTREKAIENARGRLFLYGEDGRVLVEYGPKKPDWYDVQ